MQSPSPSLRIQPPGAISNAANEAIELAESAGLILDHWQCDALRSMLGETDEGKWAALESVVITQRQNGKGSILEARELAGLVLFGERLIIHSAHLFPTSLEAFSRIDQLIDQCDDLRRLVLRVMRSHGEEGIHLRSGARLLFRARTKGSGRGFTGDCIVLDEAGVDLPSKAISSMLSTLSARPNPQVIYTSTVPREADYKTEHLRRMRKRARSDRPGSLSWIEWSAPPGCDLDDKAAWQAANPAWGIRISEEFTKVERDSLTDDDFACERLGIWPPEPEDEGEDGPIDEIAWDLCKRTNATLQDPVVFAVEADPNLDRISVVAAGGWVGGDMVELAYQGNSVPEARAWILTRCQSHEVTSVVVDGRGPASILIPELECASDVTLYIAKTNDVTIAASRFIDSINENRISHLGDESMRDSALGISIRPVGDRFAFERRTLKTDPTPVIAASLALWYHQTMKPEEPKPIFAY